MAEIGYLAGLLDGEGCFSIRTNGRGSSFAEVSVKLTDPRPLKFLVDAYGGKIYKRSKVPAGYKPQWDWYIRSTKKDFSVIANLLSDVLPILVIKRLNCLLLLEYIRFKYLNESIYTEDQLLKASNAFNQTGDQSIVLKLVEDEIGRL